MTLALIGIIIGLLVGAGVIYLVLRPQIQKQEELNHSIISKNEKAKLEYEQLQLAKKELDNDYRITSNDLQDLALKLQEMQKAASVSAEEFYNSAKQLAMQKYEMEEKALEEKFQQAKLEYEEEYESVLKDAASGFLVEIADKQEQIQKLNDTLATESAIVLAAVEANKRAAEMSAKADFYKLNVSKEDLEEIQQLRECISHLRNPEPLNKVIWKAYYEKPYTDLIGRVVGSGIHCGIYKITNLNNGMCYVGQAVNIADRWRQHIKRGLGAETPTHNKLYPTMLAIGVENFSFEIIEECDRALLNDREDYWQEYFKAKEFGYSIK